MTSPPPPAWNTELWWRMRRLFLLKLVGTSAWIWVFFLGYFQLLRHPVHPVTQIPLTPLDALIPFQPTMLYPYLSLWLYVGIAPGLMPGLRALLAYGLWAAGLGLAGLGIFYAWPTGVPPLTIDVSDIPGFRMLQGVDATGNACPSMHVAFAMFSAIWLAHLFNRVGAPGALRAINLMWFLAITWSTVAIRQHVVLDAAAGALLGAVFALASLRWQPQGPGARGAPSGAAIIDRMPADIAP
jgi:hypothetical protein